MFLFAFTAVERVLFMLLTLTFAIQDWIYVSGHLLVLWIAFTRRPPQAQDLSSPSSIAVLVAYAYPYAQVMYLRWESGSEAWPDVGLVLVMLGACLSFASVLSLGRWFVVWPALRGLGGPPPPPRFLVGGWEGEECCAIDRARMPAF